MNDMQWLPNGFDEQLIKLTNAMSETKEGYLDRAEALKHCFQEVVAKTHQDGLYGDRAVNEAFMRLYNEPGRDLNMEEWNKKHNDR